MPTAAQSAANVRTATAMLARSLGIYTNDGSGFEYVNLRPEQQVALTNAVASYIVGRPDLFDAATINNAMQARNTPIGSTSISLGEFTDAFIENARAINPLDPQNLPTVGKYLFYGALTLGAVYLVVTFLPAAIAKSKVKVV